MCKETITTTDQKKQAPICTYQNDGIRCNRQVYKAKHCLFHTPIDHENRISDIRYLSLLRVLIRQNDGDWDGFIFPSNIEIDNLSILFEIKARNCVFGSIKLNLVTFEKSVNISSSKIGRLVQLNSSNFKDCLNIDKTHFKSDRLLNSTIIEKSLNAESCHFRSNFFISGTIGGSTNFNSSTFYAKAKFQATKNVTANLTIHAGQINMTAHGVTMTVTRNNEPFIEFVIRTGKRIFTKVKNSIVSIIKNSLSQIKKRGTNSKRYIVNLYHRTRIRFPHKQNDTVRHVLFKGDVHFENVTFIEPTKVIFQGIDLRNTFFGGTDLRKVEFVGNNWFQAELNRNGLKEDLYQRTTANYYDKREMLPKLGNSYRNIRYSLESNKDFSRANNFFIGEMEAKRKQYHILKRYIFSLSAWYNYISKYGTSPSRCLIWFLLAAATHSFFISDYLIEGAKISSQNLSSNWNEFIHKANLTAAYDVLSTVSLIVSDLARIYVYSLQTMTLQKEKIEILIQLDQIDTYIPFINTLYSILGPILAGLFALTIRTCIKRH